LIEEIEKEREGERARESKRERERERERGGEVVSFFSLITQTYSPISSPASFQN
jgi:hypothetical protein